MQVDMPTSPDAISHFVPVIQIFVWAIGLLAIFIIAIWRGFRWLDEQITKRHQELIADWVNMNELRHQANAKAIEELRVRDGERVSAITRLHSRVDQIWQRLGGAP